MYSEPSYDAYLAKCVEDYYDSCCDGEPKVISVEKEYEGRDEDGNIEYSESYTYSCEECDNRECEHWAEYNDTEEEEDEGENQ